MAKFAYVRVSDQSQKTHRQLDALQGLNIPEGSIYIEKQSGKDTKRPQLQMLMNKVQTGDIIIVESISRFARNTKDLLELVERLTKKNVEFISLKEHIDTTTPTGRFMLTVLGAVSELEREYILERQAEGIAAAKTRGVKFGRPRQKTPNNFHELAKRHQMGKITLRELLQESGLTKSTLYRRLSEWRATNPKR
ncbi:MAG: recombinase family protein [Defluviitaleaceae bacterium]|nr:recombinase family protein [Defluviitaleaceae bacterium]